MTTRNYFRAGYRENPTYVFFDDDDAGETQRAHDFIMQTKKELRCVFRPTRFPGAWDELPLVGHRSPNAIRSCMGADSEKKVELAAIEKRFIARRGGNAGLS
jgi:hypothetical protein